MHLILPQTFAGYERILEKDNHVEMDACAHCLAWSISAALTQGLALARAHGNGSIELHLNPPE
jgi:hypothetical protein